MPLLFAFVMGVANFAMHRAVQESGHPALASVPGFSGRRGKRMALAFEFLVLLAALLLTVNHSPAWVLAYGLYTAANGLAAWLILSQRL